MSGPAAISQPLRQFRRRAELPGVRILELTLEAGLSRAIPQQHGSVVYLEGKSEWSVTGERYLTRAGTVGVKVPGEVYTEHARSGRSRFEVVVYDDALVEAAYDAWGGRGGRAQAQAFDGRQDARVRPLVHLHRTLNDNGSSQPALQQALAEALTALVELTRLPGTRLEQPAKWSEAVRRARALLDEQLTSNVTLDDLAAHARLDKFRLCRAFREQVGLPPYAYVTHRRVYLAQQLLGRGVPQAEVATQVGLYDQSQLHRHFKRIVGVTPGAYAKALR